MGFMYNALVPPKTNENDYTSFIVLFSILLSFSMNASLVVLAYLSSFKILENSQGSNDSSEEPTNEDSELESDDSPVSPMDTQSYYTDNRGNPIDKPELLVTVIRGVPGIGKTQYAYYLESLENDQTPFSICDPLDFFYIDGDYYYRKEYVDRAKEYCLSKYINSIKDGIKRIYVVSHFQNVYMYQNYIDIAQEYGYKWKVDELVCPNVDYLWLYNKRNKHRIPMNKSLSIFNSWEIDEDANLVNPFISTETMDSWSGDCIPKYGITKKDLDDELLYIINGIETEPKYRVISYNKDKNYVDAEFVAKKTRKELKIWEITKVAKRNHFLTESSKKDFDHYFYKWGSDYCDAIFDYGENVLDNVYTNVDTNTTYFHPYQNGNYI